MWDVHGGVPDERIRKAVFAASRDGRYGINAHDLGEQLFVSDGYARQILARMYDYGMLSRSGTRREPRYYLTSDFIAMRGNPLSEGMQALIGTGVFIAVFAGLLYAMKPAAVAP